MVQLITLSTSQRTQAWYKYQFNECTRGTWRNSPERQDPARISPNTWRSLIKVNVFTKAYFHKGDIMHDQLKQLFDYEHDISNEIIQLSSSEPNKCMPNSSKAPILVDESNDEQEVESPLLGSRVIPRKRLFHEEEPAGARTLFSLVSNTKSTFTTMSTMTGITPYPLRNAFPPKPKLHTRTTILVPKKESSSCASNSPNKSFPSPTGNK